MSARLILAAVLAAVSSPFLLIGAMPALAAEALSGRHIDTFQPYKIVMDALAWIEGKRRERQNRAINARAVEDSRLK